MVSAHVEMMQNLELGQQEDESGRHNHSAHVHPMHMHPRAHDNRQENSPAMASPPTQKSVPKREEGAVAEGREGSSNPGQMSWQGALSRAGRRARIVATSAAPDVLAPPRRVAKDGTLPPWRAADSSIIPAQARRLASVGSAGNWMGCKASLVMIVAFARMSAVGAFGSGGGSNQHCHSGRGILPSASRARCLCGGGEGPGSHASRAGFERSMTTLRGGSAPSSDKLSFNGVDGDDGRIELIIGPMFAGKSTELMRRIRRHKLAWRSCIVIKYASDQRHGEASDELSTHDKVKIQAVPCMQLYDVFETASEYDVVGIDEAQFYPDLIRFCDELASMGKIVILSALDGNFKREPFGQVLELIPRSESVTKLSSVCKLCRREASFTRRTTSDTQLEAIGGSEMYMPTCRRCHTAEIPVEEGKPSDR